MPQENEVWYVLEPGRDPESLLAALAGLPGASVKKIKNLYLQQKTTLRKTEHQDGRVERTFRFKRKIMVGGRLRIVEIENPIGDEDYRLLKKTCAVRVSKTRVSLKDGDVVWDVDFLRDPKTKEIYFVRAEAEMPPDMDAPRRVHPAIAGLVLFNGGRTGGMGNRRLADREAAEKLLKGLRRSGSLFRQADPQGSVRELAHSPAS
jgi:hypothetical protein